MWVGWESIKEKYENIREIFVSNLPKETGSDECAHSADLSTRERIASKIKQIRAKYWRTLEAERQSEGGRIVATFYDLCSEKWSNSPGTESIQTGLETVENLKALADEDVDPLERASKENNNVVLREKEDVGDELLLWSVQLLVLLLV